MSDLDFPIAIVGDMKKEIKSEESIYLQRGSPVSLTTLLST